LFRGTGHILTPRVAKLWLFDILLSAKKVEVDRPFFILRRYKYPKLTLGNLSLNLFPAR